MCREQNGFTAVLAVLESKTRASRGAGKEHIKWAFYFGDNTTG